MISAKQPKLKKRKTVLCELRNHKVKGKDRTIWVRTMIGEGPYDYWDGYCSYCGVLVVDGRQVRVLRIEKTEAR